MWVSDMALWVVYAGIALVMLTMAYEEDKPRLRWAYLLFAAFIASCGITHLARGTNWGSLLTIINPVCAIISGATLVYLLLHLQYFCSLREYVDGLEQRKREMEESIGTLLHIKPPDTPHGTIVKSG